jgi:hypothetical protein
MSYSNSDVTKLTEKEYNSILQDTIIELKRHNLALSVNNMLVKNIMTQQDERVKKLEKEKQILLQSIETYKSVILLLHNKK